MIRMGHGLGLGLSRPKLDLKISVTSYSYFFQPVSCLVMSVWMAPITFRNMQVLMKIVLIHVLIQMIVITSPIITTLADVGHLTVTQGAHTTAMAYLGISTAVVTI